MFSLTGNKLNHSRAVTQTDIYMVLLAFALLLGPSVLRLPLIATGFVLLMLVYRAAIAKLMIGFPSKLGKVALVGTVVLITVTSSGWVFSVNAAVTFYALVISLKLFEIKFYRDLYVYVLLLLYFLATEFLFDQSVFLVLYQSLCVLAIFYILFAINTSMSTGVSVWRLTVIERLKICANILLQAIPVMVVLFIFFPRMAPLWSVPLSSGQARTGISDTMTPGDLSELVQSDKRAFRAQFKSLIPPKQRMYWRGLVLDQFDGRTWRASERQPHPRMGKMASIQLNENVSDRSYTIIMEPTEKRWAFAFESATPASSNIVRNQDGLLRFRQPVFQTTIYRVDHRAEKPYDLSREERRRHTQTPYRTNPLTRAFVSDLKKRTASLSEFVNTILLKFRNEDFVYTLRPPPAGSSGVDDFLFGTKRGFCAHYAGSFVFMARLAGIPARVVVGYQGGEIVNDSYVSVHQYDAHAWAEIWDQGRGWMRIDPTAFVAPERIESGIREAAQEEGSFLENTLFSVDRYAYFQWVNWVRWQIDALNYHWRKWVVSYNEDAQHSLLKDWFDNSSLVLMAGAMLVLSAVVFLIMYFYVHMREAGMELSPYVRAYLEFCRFFEKKGLPRGRGEGPVSYANRIVIRYPIVGNEVKALTESLVRAVYAKESSCELDQNSVKAGPFRRARDPSLRAFKASVSAVIRQVKRNE